MTGIAVPAMELAREHSTDLEIVFLAPGDDEPTVGVPRKWGRGGRCGVEMTGKSSVGTRKKRPVVGIAIVLLLFVVPGLLFFVIPSGITAYDDSHRIPITCTIRSAVSGTESSGSFKGGGASGPQVVVVTEQCGKILLQDGINSSNADAVAKDVSSADRVRFKVGDAAYRLRAQLAILGVSPTAYSFKVVSGS
jgi:hypothetical protein